MNESVNRTPRKENVGLGIALGSAFWLPYSACLLFGFLLALVVPDFVVTKWLWSFVDWFDKPGRRISKSFWYTIWFWMIGCSVLGGYVTYLAIRARSGF